VQVHVKCKIPKSVILALTNKPGNPEEGKEKHVSYKHVSYKHASYKHASYKHTSYKHTSYFIKFISYRLNRVKLSVLFN
jgi:hypothetical protein